MPNYTDAKAEWQRALREADGDPETARGLLARVALELEAQRPMLKRSPIRRGRALRSAGDQP